MAKTISKAIGEGFGSGELYAALAYDSSDVFGGMKIKSVMFNSTGKAYFRDSGLYIYSSTDGQLDIVADTLCKFSTPIQVGVDDTGHDVKFYGATSGAYMLWDESEDELVLSTGASIDLTASKVMIDFKDGDASTIDPSTTAETGWININVDGTKRYIPYYAAS